MRSELIFLCIEPKHFVMLSCPSIDTVEVCRGQVMNRNLDKLYSRSRRSTDQSGGHFPGAQVYNLDQQSGSWYKFGMCDETYHSKGVLEEASAVTPLTPQLHYGKDSESKIKSYLLLSNAPFFATLILSSFCLVYINLFSFALLDLPKRAYFNSIAIYSFVLVSQTTISV